jgi:hypothetical protein
MYLDYGQRVKINLGNVPLTRLFDMIVYVTPNTMWASGRS